MATGGLGGDDDWVEIKSQRLDVAGAHDYLADATGRWGATVVFLGRVRRFTDPSHTGFFPAGVVLSGGPAVVETPVVETPALHYECYPEMAQRAIQGLLAECRQRWSLGRLVVQHRVGRLVAGEVAILIGVSSSHRAAAYAANQYLIDEIKRRVPVWKQEIYPSGATTWVHPRPDRVQ
jgi:molybdopterin synthase catalytic subunit